MKKILIFAFALLVCSLSAQVNNIYRSGGISQTVGAPTFKPGASGNIVAIDTVTGIWYISRDRYSVNWLSMGYRIENISGCSAPAYTPNKMNSTLVINSCSPPEMYAYNGATWEQVAGGGGGGLTTEQVQDIVAAMLVDGDGITTGYSDVDGLITVTNTAPDQTVTLSSGAGISATGTYPNFTVASTITQYTDENAQDAIGAMIGNTLTYVDATPLLDVKTQMSITSDASGVKLSGDAATPGATMLYGTNGSGTKGWYAQPSGGGGGSDYLGTGFTSGGSSGTFPDGTHAALNDAMSTFYIDYSPAGQAAIAFEPDPGLSSGTTYYSPDGGTYLGVYNGGPLLTSDGSIQMSGGGVVTNLTSGVGIEMDGGLPLFPPKLTTTNRDLLTPNEGALIANSTTHAPNWNNGTEWKVLEPLPTLGTSLQQIRVNSGGTALEYFTPSSLGITDLTGDVTATGPGSASATISSFAVTSAKIANNAVNGTKIAMTGDTQGDVLYYDGTDYVRLPPGTSGQFLQTLGTGANPVWGTPSGSGDIANGGNTTGAAITIGTNDAFGLNLETNNVTRVSITGAASTGGAWTATDVTANTNTVETANTYITNSSGSVSSTAGFGMQDVYQLETTTTDAQDAAAIGVSWSDPVHASRTADLIFSTVASANALTEAMRLGGTNYKLTLTANISGSTTSVTDRIGIVSNNTAATGAGFGGGIRFTGKSSTTADRDMARFLSYWSNATDANRTSNAKLQLVNSAGALADYFTFATNGGTSGLFSIGTSNAVQISSVAMTTASSYTIGNSASALTLGGSAGAVTVGGSNGQITLNTSANVTPVTIQSSGTGNIAIHSTSNTASTTASIVFGNATSFTQTSGTRNYVDCNWSFAPTSGTAIHNQLSFTGTLNQSGGANGIVRGINIAHTVTAVADYRAIEIADNGSNVKGIYQTGSTTTNSFVGKTGFGATATPAEAVSITGNLQLVTAGNKLKIATGSNASIGTATLVAGTVTVSTTAVETGSIIMVSCNTPGGVQGALSAPVASIVNGTSFVINSSNAADTSTANWWIVN